MPVLKPIIEADGIELPEEEVSNALRSDEALDFANTLLAKDEKTKHLANSEEEVRSIMEEAGIGLRDTIHQLASLQKHGSSESIRMRALEKSLEALNVIGKKQDSAGGANISINIVTDKAGLVNQIFNPQRG